MLPTKRKFNENRNFLRYDFIYDLFYQQCHCRYIVFICTVFSRLLSRWMKTRFWTMLKVLIFFECFAANESS